MSTTALLRRLRFVVNPLLCERAMSSIAYPLAPRHDISSTYPGNTVVQDPYRWLEDPDSPETVSFVEAQNKTTQSYLDKFDYPGVSCTSGFSKKNSELLRDAISKVYEYEKFSAPRQKEDKFWYWSYNPGLLNQAQIWRSKSLSRVHAELFFDPNRLSDDATVSLASASFSADGSMYAYAISRSGSDNNTIFVRPTTTPFTDLAADGRLSDEIKYVKFSSISWTKDSKGFIYHRYPEKDSTGTGTASDIDSFLCYHRIGTLQESDLVLHKDSDHPTHMFAGFISDDGNYLLITTSEGTAHVNKLTIVELENQAITSIEQIEKNKVVVVDDFHASFDYITNYGSRFVFQTNENASREKLVVFDMKNPTLGFQDLVPEQQDVLNSTVPVRGDKLILTYTHDVKDEVSIFSSSGDFEKKLDLPLGSAVHGVTTSNEKAQEFFITVGSFVNPSSVWYYPFETEELQMYRSTQVEGINPEDYDTEQVFYPAKDGLKIPMFVTSLKSNVTKTPLPTILYGYGGFQIPVGPAFSPHWITFMKNFNGRIAVANIRGGGEYGVDWWKAAILKKRHTAFEDFQHAALYLSKEKYTSPEKLAIYGGSNGGLLCGVCLEQRPELYGAVIAAVGVMDMLRFHKFTIGAAWMSDYGDPESEAMFEYIKAYSPLHNVHDDRKDGKIEYPATLLLTADHDDRVVPCHTLKLIAELQYKKPGNAAPLLVRVETQAGHGAGKPTWKKIDEVSRKFNSHSL